MFHSDSYRHPHCLFVSIANHSLKQPRQLFQRCLSDCSILHHALQRREDFLIGQITGGAEEDQRV